MKVYYETELGKLYHGDCLEIIPHLEPVDLVLTDPPYPEDSRFMFSFDKLQIVARQLFKISSVNSWLLSDFFRPGMSNYITSFSQGWVYYDLITAFVVNSMANCSFGIDRFTPSLVFKKGTPKINKKWSNVIQTTRKSHSKGWSGHPSQKYLNVYITYIRMCSKTMDNVLDPFLGSGTTAIACEHLNRQWIGIEIEEKYCEIAAKQIEAEARKPSFSKIKRKEDRLRKLNELERLKGKQAQNHLGLESK